MAPLAATPPATTMEVEVGGGLRTVEDCERLFALGFSLEKMRQNLKDLERCVAEWSETKLAAPTPEPD